MQRENGLFDHNTLDLCSLPQEWTGLRIVEALENMRRGDSFELLLNHDVDCIKQGVEMEFVGRIKWETLEEGPEIWKVLIQKLA